MDATTGASLVLWRGRGAGGRDTCSKRRAVLLAMLAVLAVRDKGSGP